MAETLEQLLKSAQSGQVYKAPPQKNLKKAMFLFQKTMRKTIDWKLKEEWRSIGFESFLIEEAGQDYLVLREIPTAKQGRGFFLFSLSQNKLPVILQMPHSFKDLHTGTIGLKLALENQFTAAAWNTASRDEKAIKSDLSDLYNTYFAALTKAFVSTFKKGYVVQLHGFSKNKNRDENIKDADVIVSSGRYRPLTWINELDLCLEQHLEINSRVFPREVETLGATKTSIGIIMHQMGHAGFIHLEMSKPVRVQLNEDFQYRQKLFTCFKKVLQ